MHRQLVLSGDPGALSGLVRELQARPEVITLTLLRGASRKPEGDVLIIDVMKVFKVVVF
jgi:hypothetical protein